jgi:hypothetical protein
MRRMVLAVGLVPGIAAAAIGAGAWAWRRNPRMGTRLMNDRVNPLLLRHGVSGEPASEIGILEHVGRRSGVRRLTPVHPEHAPDGFRIMVPLADRSEWAQNVLAAGHCRLELQGIVHELDEPVMLFPADVEGIAGPVRWATSALGFRYLRLHRFAAAPGTLNANDAAGATADEPGEGGTTPGGPPALEHAQHVEPRETNPLPAGSGA